MISGQRSSSSYYCRFLLLQQKVSGIITLFIDGLDEYEGQHDVIQEILNRVVDMSSGFRFVPCTTSHPWRIFDETFLNYSM